MRLKTLSGVVRRRVSGTLPGVLLLAVACSDEPKPGPHSSNGGEAGAAMFEGSGGSRGKLTGKAGAAGVGGRPAIPPAPGVESCAELAMTFAGHGCASVCASVSCACDPFPASYLGCNQTLGCLTGVDCDVACARDLGAVVDCIGKYAP